MISGRLAGAPWFAVAGVEPIYAMAAGVMAGGALQLAAHLVGDAAYRGVAAAAPGVASARAVRSQGTHGASFT